MGFVTRRKSVKFFDFQVLLHVLSVGYRVSNPTPGFLVWDPTPRILSPVWGGIPHQRFPPKIRPVWDCSGVGSSSWVTIDSLLLFLLRLLLRLRSLLLLHLTFPFAFAFAFVFACAFAFAFEETDGARQRDVKVKTLCV